VVRVVDGDTIEARIGGTIYTIRYIGLDAPESVKPGSVVEPFGPEASEKNRELVDGKAVLLEKDLSNTDRFGRLLRYVYVDLPAQAGDIFINDYLVREGYARASTYPPDVRYADTFTASEREARGNSRGLWGACGDSVH
jgi:micrococcal nuclease